VSTLFHNAHVVTMDDDGNEHPDGWLLVDDGFVHSTGTSQAPDADERVDLGGAVVTPGLINTHHHLWQNLTRARAQDENLFGWLTALYPIWARLDAEAEYAAAKCGLAELALSGCTTVFDHHYLFPNGGNELLEAEIRAARELGVRIVASRGSMDLGESDGGLPPDAVVEDRDEVLAATEAAAALADGAHVQIAVAPCSPFSVTKELMRESAELARKLDVKLHTHLVETVEEEEFALEKFGCTPMQYVEELGWLAEDVWCAHCVHLKPEDVSSFATHGVGVAHCPSSNMRLGAGVAPVRDLLDAGVRIVVVSGGLREAVAPFAAALGVPDADVHAVRVDFDAAGEYAGYDEASPLATAAGKRTLVESLALPAPALAVGDGATDLAIRPAVAAFAAFTGFVRRAAVVEAAAHVVPDFTHLQELVLR
jgi:cytosine/adenosine deaminase-related metal-dependent hydrolase